MRYRSLVVIFITLLLAGCATQRIPFPENELAGLDLQGEVVISGKIFLIDQFEEKQIGKESEIILEPSTGYSDQWYEIKYLQNKSLARADRRYEQYLKRVKADKEGRFSITGVAPGEYLLTGSVFWEAITCSVRIAKTEILISKKITVKESDTSISIPFTKEFESPTIVCDLYNQSEWEKED